MKSEFLAGFIKFASDAGIPAEDIPSVWKTAMQHPQAREIFDSLPVSSDTLDVNTLSVLSHMKQAMDHKDEVQKMREVLKTVCA